MINPSENLHDGKRFLSMVVTGRIQFLCRREWISGHCPLHGSRTLQKSIQVHPGEDFGNGS